MRMTSLFAAGAVLAAVGCSGEDVAPVANLSGTWDFSYVLTSASGVVCHSELAFTISQTDQTFVGFQRDHGRLFCDGVNLRLVSPNTADPTAFDGEMITSGVASESEVAFALNLLKSHDAGMVVQNGLMTGTATWTVPIQPKGSITVSGTWTAFKRNP